MTIVDSSSWINHIHRPNPELLRLLEEESICVHPFVIGEIACGHIGQRDHVLRGLRRQRRAPVVDTEEVFQLVEDRKLYGRGLSFVDTNLLASALTGGCRVMTSDTSLARAADELGLQTTT